jgi:putative hemolysin
MTRVFLMVVSIVGSGFFSGTETGLYCLSRLRLRLKAERGGSSARLLHWLAANPKWLISTMLVGTNLGVYVATILCTQWLFEAGLAGRADFYAGLIMPPILLVFAEMIPKFLMQQRADSAMYPATWPLAAAQFAFLPLSLLLRGVSALPHLLFGRTVSARPPALTDTSFRHYFREGVEHGVLSGFQRRAAMNIMRLRSVAVAEAMTPLDQVIMIAEDASGEELLGLFGRHRYSRIPVHGRRRESVIGVINVIDVASVEGGSLHMRALAREPLRLQRGASVADALRAMRHSRQPLAIVTDEQGAALGIVTVKDLVEEIVGELEAW